MIALVCSRVTSLATESVALPTVSLHGCSGLSVMGRWVTETSATDFTVSSQVAEFRGIPYAKPPVGELRWRSPVPVICPRPQVAGSLTFNATEHGNICPQSSPLSPTVIKGDEDCLYLNVHVPEVVLMNRTTAKVPVIVFIHGGDLTFGAGSHYPFSYFSAYASGKENAAPTLDNTVVSVTINYRLALLGFMAVEEMVTADGNPSAGNWGTRDQIAALQWIQANIASFGGDPSRVTITGQSSGATSVFALTISPVTKGLFSSAIAWSGSPNMTMDAATKRRQDAAVVSVLGCDGLGNAYATMRCLRAVNASTVVAAMPASWGLQSLFRLTDLNNQSASGLSLPGIIFVDGEIVERPLLEALREGFGGNVTLVLGSMGQEIDLAPPHPDVAKMSVANMTAVFNSQVFQTFANPNEKTQAFISLYQDAVNIDPELAATTFGADYGALCGQRELVQAATADNNGRTAPVYHYVNQYAPQTGIGLTNDEFKFAYHIWDVLCFTTDYFHYFPYVPGNEDLELSKTLRAAWFAVIENGSMSSAWPAVQPGNFSSYVWSRTSRYPGLGDGAQMNYKKVTCDGIINQFGLGQNYWWAN